jgi:hypothetical protein
MVCDWLLAPTIPPIRGLLAIWDVRIGEGCVSTTRYPLCALQMSIMLRPLYCEDGSSFVSGNLGVLALVAH